jgi:hypothetical protein
LDADGASLGAAVDSHCAHRAEACRRAEVIDAFVRASASRASHQGVMRK